MTTKEKTKGHQTQVSTLTPYMIHTGQVTIHESVSTEAFLSFFRAQETAGPIEGHSHIPEKVNQAPFGLCKNESEWVIKF